MSDPSKNIVLRTLRPLTLSGAGKGGGVRGEGEDFLFGNRGGGRVSDKGRRGVHTRAGGRGGLNIFFLGGAEMSSKSCP